MIILSDIVFGANELVKNYNGFYALNKLNMQIKKGDIYGFIGENGAGKTTTIRVITGLIQPTSGEFELFGTKDPKEIIKNRQKIGCIIEYPALYPDMTARQNLEVQRIQRGIDKKNAIDEVLEIVGLTDTGKRKCKDFSLGMRQRLGLAIALLGDPEFLVLDEPTNGLDPIGIIEMRQLLKKLNKEKGITILISSHILSELHQTVTCYGIIHKGVMLEQITQEEMNEKCSKYIHLRVTDKEKALVVLEKELNTKKFEIDSNESIRLNDYTENVNHVATSLYNAGIGIKEIAVKGETLESYFKTLLEGA